MSDDAEPSFHGSMPPLTFQQRTKSAQRTSEQTARAHTAYRATPMFGHTARPRHPVNKGLIVQRKGEGLQRSQKIKPSAFMTSIHNTHPHHPPISPGLSLSSLPLPFLLIAALFLSSFFCPALLYLLQNCQITLARFTLHACGKNSREPRRNSLAPVPSLHSVQLKYQHYFIHDESHTKLTSPR